MSGAVDDDRRGEGGRRGGSGERRQQDDGGSFRKTRAAELTLELHTRTAHGGQLCLLWTNWWWWSFQPSIFFLPPHVHGFPPGCETAALQETCRGPRARGRACEGSAGHRG